MTIKGQMCYYKKVLRKAHADVAELADALVLGTSVNDVGVQVPSSAPMTFLFELTDRLKIIQVSWMIFFFVKKTSSNILKRKDGV